MNFFDSLIDMFTQLFDFFVNSWKMMIMFYRYIIAMIETVFYLFPSIPTIIATCAYAVVIFGVLKLILGRMSQ